MKQYVRSAREWKDMPDEELSHQIRKTELAIKITGIIAPETHKAAASMGNQVPDTIREDQAVIKWRREEELKLRLLKNLQTRRGISKEERY